MAEVWSGGAGGGHGRRLGASRRRERQARGRQPGQRDRGSARPVSATAAQARQRNGPRHAAARVASVVVRSREDAGAVPRTACRGPENACSLFAMRHAADSAVWQASQPSEACSRQRRAGSVAVPRAGSKGEGGPPDNAARLRLRLQPLVTSEKRARAAPQSRGAVRPPTRAWAACASRRRSRLGRGTACPAGWRGTVGPGVDRRVGSMNAGHGQ